MTTLLKRIAEYRASKKCAMDLQRAEDLLASYMADMPETVCVPLSRRKVRFLAAGIFIGYFIMFALGFVVAANWATIERVWK